MKTDARFIGKDGSCGLKRLRIYQIEIEDHRNDRHDWAEWRVFVNDKGIPYDTMEAIKKNWRIPPN